MPRRLESCSKHGFDLPARLYTMTGSTRLSGLHGASNIGVSIESNRSVAWAMELTFG
jgi:hypothetical protein